MSLAGLGKWGLEVEGASRKWTDILVCSMWQSVSWQPNQGPLKLLHSLTNTEGDMVMVSSVITDKWINWWKWVGGENIGANIVMHHDMRCQTADIYVTTNGIHLLVQRCLLNLIAFANGENQDVKKCLGLACHDAVLGWCPAVQLGLEHCQGGCSFSCPTAAKWLEQVEARKRAWWESESVWLGKGWGMAVWGTFGRKSGLVNRKVRATEAREEGQGWAISWTSKWQQLVPIWYIMIQIFKQTWGPHSVMLPCDLFILPLCSHLSNLRLDLTIASPPYLQHSSWSYHLLSLHLWIFCPLDSYLAIWTTYSCASHFNYILPVIRLVMAEIASASGGSKLYLLPGHSVILMYKVLGLSAQTIIHKICYIRLWENYIIHPCWVSLSFFSRLERPFPKRAPCAIVPSMDGSGSIHFHYFYPQAGSDHFQQEYPLLHHNAAWEMRQVVVGQSQSRMIHVE